MVNPSVEKQHFIFVPHKTSMDRKTKMFRTKKNIQDHRNTTMGTKRAAECDTGDKVKFVINLLPLVDFLG